MLLLTLVVAISFIACGGRTGPAGDAWITHLEQLTAATCACKDKACATQKLKQLEQLGASARPSEFTDKQRKRMAELGGKLGPCLVKRGVTVEEVQRAAAKMH